MRVAKALRVAAAALSLCVVVGCGQTPSELGARGPSPSAEVSVAVRSASEAPTPSATPTRRTTSPPTPSATPSQARTSRPSATPSESKSPTPKRTPDPEPSPEKSAPPDPPKKRSGGKRVVYLTFDDGPSTYTDEVLDILDDYGAKATFFVIGENIGGDPSAVRAMRRAGMSVQNHSWGHPDLTMLSSREIRSQISRTDRAIEAAGGGESTCVRPPYGASSSRVRSVLRDMGKQQMLWTIDTLDWERPGADRIYRRVVDAAAPGAIILAHDGGGEREQTVAALPRILATLKDAGYRFGTLC